MERVETVVSKPAITGLAAERYRSGSACATASTSVCVVKPGPSSERAVVLASTERDATETANLIKQAGYHADICGDLAALKREIGRGAGLAVIADDVIKDVDLSALTRWLNEQPSWSDVPIVLLTHQGGSPERNPDAA